MCAGLYGVELLESKDCPVTGSIRGGCDLNGLVGACHGRVALTVVGADIHDDDVGGRATLTR